MRINKLLKKLYRVIAISMSATMLLTACGDDMNDTVTLPGVGGTAEEIAEGPLSMEETAILDYEAPRHEPTMIVDRDGYSCLEEKYAFIVVDELPASFSVINSDTEEVVFEGVPYGEKYNEELGMYTAKLIFAELEEPGTYYITASGLGRSFDFTISKDHFRILFEELLEKECGKCRDFSASIWEVYSLIYVYERYPSVLPDIDEEVPDLIKAVRDWISGTDLDSTEGEDTYLLAATLAKFGYNYRQIDATLANECVQKASSIYSKRENAKSYPELALLANAELYRALADSTYSEEIVAFSNYMEMTEYPHDSLYVLYGSMCYLTTRQTVDRNLCNSFLEALLRECEAKNKDSQIFDPSGPTAEDAEAALVSAQQFEVINFILDGYEYNANIANIYHMLNGQNTAGIVYDLAADYPADTFIVLAWLSYLEKEGKLDSSAPVVWDYSW